MAIFGWIGVLFIVISIILAYLSASIVGTYSHNAGEFLDRQRIHPILTLFFMGVFAVIYKAFSWLLGKKKEEVVAEIEKSQEKNGGSLNSDNDLYLIKNSHTDDLIEYQIENKGKVPFWQGKCILTHGSVQSIELFSSSNINEVVLKVSIQANDSSELLVKNGEVAIGSLKLTNSGLVFCNSDNKPVYSAILEGIPVEKYEKVADFILRLDSLDVSAYPQKKAFFRINDQNDEMLGKYYYSLKNMDLTLDENSKFDRRIAAVFLMLLDAKITSYI